MFHEIDSELIRLFESASHRFQLWTGRNNFWLGWLMFWCEAVCQIVKSVVTNVGKGFIAASVAAIAATAMMSFVQIVAV